MYLWDFHSTYFYLRKQSNHQHRESNPGPLHLELGSEHTTPLTSWEGRIAVLSRFPVMVLWFIILSWEKISGFKDFIHFKSNYELITLDCTTWYLIFQWSPVFIWNFVYIVCAKNILLKAFTIQAIKPKVLSTISIQTQSFSFFKLAFMSSIHAYSFS